MGDSAATYGKTGVSEVYQQYQHRCVAATGRLFPAGTRASQPQGSFVLWIELPPAFDGYVLAQQAMAEHISIAPGAIFSPTPASGKAEFNHFIRLNCAVEPDARLERAIQVLAKLSVQQLNERYINTL